jgi:hypothetical protein
MGYQALVRRGERLTEPDFLLLSKPLISYAIGAMDEGGSASEREYVVKREHHYLPVSYLKGFCDANGKIWEFNREFPKLRDRGPRSTGYREYLYTISTLLGWSEIPDRSRGPT